MTLSGKKGLLVINQWEQVLIPILMDDPLGGNQTEKNQTEENRLNPYSNG